MMKLILCLCLCILSSLSSLEAANITVAAYLARRLMEVGATKVFGVTGDYSYLFLHAVEANPNLTRITNHNELEASYAAWGFARASPTHSPGVVCVTYTVGAYIALTGVVGADVDNVPVIFIAGTPALTAWQEYDSFGAAAHHIAGSYTTQRTIFSHFTEAQAIIRNSQRAPDQIDEVILAALAFRRPVYLDVWTDVWNQLVPEPTTPLNPAQVVPFAVTQSVINNAVQLTVTKLQGAKFPAIFAGAELKAYGLQDLFERFYLDLPYFTNAEAKGIISEFNPKYVTSASVASQIDFLLELGTVYGDSDSRNLGTYAPNACYSIRARRNSVQTSSRVLYSAVPLKLYFQQLFTSLTSIGFVNPHYNASLLHATYPVPTADNPNSNLTFVNHIRYQAGIINDNTVLVVDTTYLNYYIVTNVPIGRDGYMGDNGLLTIGWTGGASLGIKEALQSTKRIMVIVGDGGFQRLATASELGHDTIVFIIEDPTPYHNLSVPFFAENYLGDWDYTQLARAYGAEGHRVYTHEDLTKAINKGLRASGTTLIEVMLPIRDYPH